MAYESRKSLLEQQGLAGMDSSIESLPPAVISSESEWLAGGTFLSKSRNELDQETSLGSRTPTPPVSESVRTDSISSEDSLSTSPYDGVAIRDFAYEERNGDVVPVSLVEYTFEEEDGDVQECDGMRRVPVSGAGRWCGELTEEPMALKLPVRGRRERIEKEEEDFVLKLPKRMSLPVKLAVVGKEGVKKRPHLTRSDDTMRNTYQRIDGEVLGEVSVAGED